VNPDRLGWLRVLLLAGLLRGQQLHGQGSSDSARAQLFAGIFRNDSAQVVAALRAGAGPNSIGQGRVTALMSAAVFSRPAMVRLLLAHGADPDLLGTDPAGGNAVNAALTGLNGMQLLGRSDEPDPEKRKRALMVVRLLLQRRADPNLLVRVGPDDMSPLMLAAQAGTPDLIALLLGGGANVDLANSGGYTALDYAVERPPAWATSSASDRLRCVRALLAAGARVNRSGVDRIPPLVRAERAGQEDIWAALKAAGAKVEP
jgi:ankyrin repeat protein